MKKQTPYNWSESLCKFVLFLFLSASSFILQAQTKFLLYNEGSAYTITYPITQDGIVLSTAGSVSNKNSTPPCSAGGWEVSSLGKTYMLSFSSGGLINIDAGAGNTITNVTVLLSTNSTSTTQIGHAAFSEDNATFAEYSNITGTGYNDCNEVSLTPTGTNYRYFSLGRGAIGGTSPSANAESRIYYVIVTVGGGPELTVSPTSLTGFTYIVGSGPSAAQSFTITGTDLTAGQAVTVAATTDYEYATVVGGPYSNTLSFANAAGGAFSQVVYARLKTGRAVALYNNQIITVAGGGASSSQTVTVSGSVTAGALIQLTTPTVGTASNVQDTYFTANWTAVANATGYTVKVYQGATEVASQYVAGAATASLIMSGLTATTAYTYKVTAVGDGLTYSDSNQSAASALFVTAAPADPTACEITLYSTNFTDWDAMDQSAAGSTAIFAAGGGGDGFSVSAKPKIVPGTDVTGFGETGYFLTMDNGSSGVVFFESKPLPFVNGGSVVMYLFNTSTSDRNFDLEIDGSSAGITASYEYLEPQAATEIVPAVASGNNFETGQNDATDKRKILYRVTFQLPAGLTGNHAVQLVSTGGGKEIAYTQFKVCTNPPVTPYVAATNYPKCIEDATGVSFSGITGSGTASTQVVSVKGWNLTGDVSISFTGADAGLFTVPSTTLAQADALSGQALLVEFMPSAISGISTAQMILSSPGAPDYCVSLTGLSASGASPEITTPAQTWQFPTKLIDTYSQDIPISGINLTGPVTLTLTGADAGQFTLSDTEFSLYEALTGTPVTVTYNGGISAPHIHNASIVLSSPGAADVTLSLEGLTYTVDPNLYTLTTSVTPAGSGFVTKDKGGNTFAGGTTVQLTATPQTGYKFVKWTDNNSTALIRNVLITSDTSIEALFEVGTAVVIAPFQAYTPLTINNTSFVARWGNADGATSYTVRAYDEDGTLVFTQAGIAGNSVTVTGLTLASSYTYQVEANTGDDSNTVGPILTTGVAPVPACGTVD